VFEVQVAEGGEQGESHWQCSQTITGERYSDLYVSKYIQHH
jgi:hypothetical protein